MDIAIILSIIIGGIFLLVLEVFLIPGTTVAGVIGLILVVLGNVFGILYLSTVASTAILLCSIIISGIMIYIGYKAIQEKGIVLEQKLDKSKITTRAARRPVSVGDRGYAFGNIRPEGKAIINNLTYNVESRGSFISDNVQLEVIEVQANIIIVKAV